MMYLGGKARLGKRIAAFLEFVRQPGMPYVEPFVGACDVMAHMTGSRQGYDANEALVSLWQHLQEGWVPPEALTREEYQALKEADDPTNPLMAFAGFGCSFAGKWFGGYATNGPKRNYALNAHRSLMKKRDALHGVRFAHAYYTELSPQECLIYCDPPYANTTGYGAVPAFDHEQFWQTMRRWAENNVVVVSEYAAPDDFACVLEMPTRTDMHTSRGQEPRMERLFMHDPL